MKSVKAFAKICQSETVKRFAVVFLLIAQVRREKGKSLGSVAKIAA